ALAPLTEAPAPEIVDEEEAPREEREAAASRVFTAASGAADGGGGSSGVRLAPPSAGASLDLAAPERVRPLVGMDLSRVRIHADGESARLADRFQARAFTWKTDLYFGPGEYAPGTRSGMRLLLHELAHIVQQSRASAPPGVIARGPLRGAA